MPVYCYIDDETGDIHEVVQGMNDLHEYYYNGKKLRRIYFAPNASIDTNVSSENSFIEKTAKMRGTVGDIQDYSRELSEKRGGFNDPIRQQYYKNYSSKRKGVKHPEVLQKERKERIKNLEKKTGLKIST
jgi:methyl-accepting chemotaxis protein